MTRTIRSKLAIALGVIATLASPTLAQPRRELLPLVNKTVPARVDAIVDGDTVHVKLADGRRITVRLDGIDAPETGEPFAAQARTAARVLLFDQQVELTGKDVDRYDRLVARLHLGAAEGAKDASVELVTAGLACHFTQYSADPVLAAAQVAAKNAHRGFWAAGAQTPKCASAATLPARGIAALPSKGPVQGPFHGNVSSRVYHSPSCKNFGCKSCTAVFTSEDAAKRAGYRPAGDCVGK